MSATEEEPPTVSRTKMKIKFTYPSPISATATATATSSQEPVKMEPEQDPDCNSENQSPKPGDLNPAPTQTPSPPSRSPSSTGKRKKKPKQMHVDFLCHTGKRMKKSFSNSGYVESSGGPKSSRQRKSLSNGVYNTNEVMTRAMIRAEELQSTLNSEFPSFTKPMVRSHVINGFWMGVPGYFGRAHLPRMDTAVVVVDESGKEFQLKYNGEKMGLSAGWRKFSIEQQLFEEDVLIFQLVEPCKFKVYVVRANDFNEVDGALSLLNLEAQIESNDAEKEGGEDKQTAPCINTYKRKLLKNKRTRLRKLVPKTLQLVKKLENGYRANGPSSSFSPDFENINNLEDFTIMVDSLCIDSELPEDIRANYYYLCSAKKEYLHARLLNSLNSKLIAGIICETIEISNAIRTCTLATSREDFENWVKTLKSFELLGMSIGFLRDRVLKLIDLAFESDGAVETKIYMEAKLGRVQAEEEIVNLKNKIVELKEASEKYNEDIEALKFEAEGYELKFQEAVDAPW